MQETPTDRVDGTDRDAHRTDRVDGADRDAPEALDVPDSEHHGARAALYGALAGVFCYPDEETVAEVTAPETLEGIVDAGETLGLESKAAALRDALAAADDEALRTAHMDLFGLPADDGEYRVVPYEANYTVRDDIGQKQRRIAKVAGAVEALGLDVADDFGERQDHVALELELLQLLAGWRAVAACTADANADPEAVARIEARIIADHLVDFVPPLAEAVRDAAEESVYLAAADLAEALVVADHARYAAEHADAGDGVASANGGEP